MAREEGLHKRRFEEDDESRDAQPPKKKRRTNKKTKKTESEATEQETETVNQEQTEETSTTTQQTDDNNEAADSNTSSTVPEKKRQRAASSKKRRYKKAKPVKTDATMRRYDVRGLEIFPDILRKPIVVEPPTGVKVQWEYSVRDKVLVWYGPIIQYEATILGRIADWNPAKENFDYEYKVHYIGWPDTWDMWTQAIEIESFSEEARKAAAENRRTQTKRIRKHRGRVFHFDKSEQSGDSNQSDESYDPRTDPKATSLAKRQAEAQYIEEEFRQVKFRKIEGRMQENCRLVSQMSRMMPIPAEKGLRVVDICESFLKSKLVTNRHDDDRRQYYQLIQNMLQLFDRMALTTCLFEKEWTYIRKVSKETGLEPKRLLGIEHFSRFLCEFGQILVKSKVHPGTHNQIMKKANSFVSFIEKNLNKFWPRLKAYENLDSLIDTFTEA